MWTEVWLALDSKEAVRLMKSIGEAIIIVGGRTMEVTIDANTFDELQDYCNRMNEPISAIATKAIKKYINASD